MDRRSSSIIFGVTFLLVFGTIPLPLGAFADAKTGSPSLALTDVELSDSVSASTSLGDIVLTGYAANYTATQTVVALERDVLLPVESLSRDENFLPESHDSQYFVAWLESDETTWEPHSHLLRDAHALMWLKASEQGPIGPEPGSVLLSGQQYGFLAAHGSMASNAPTYLPDGELTGEPFLELAGPLVTETQGVSNIGASDLGGVVVSGFMGFSGGDYQVSSMGAVSISQNFTLPEIATRSGDNYAYTWAWIRPPDTDVDVDFDMDFPSRSGTATVTVTDGYFKQARELTMPGGFVQRYWGVVFSLYLYFYPPHQEAEEGLTPHSRLLWPFGSDGVGELVAGGADWEESWSGLSEGIGIELVGNEVVRVFNGQKGTEVGQEEQTDMGTSALTLGVGASVEEAGGEDGDNEDDGNGQHLTGAGVLTYNLTTDYLDQGFVALTNITPYGHNESLVDAWGFSSLQIEGEDYPLTDEWLVDHSSVSGVWVFGVSIGWIWVSPAIQNGGDPAVKSDSWWWIYTQGGATAGLVFKVRDEVLVIARIMIRPNEGFADIVIEAGAYTLDGEQKEMKLWQHLDPSVQGDVTYTEIQRSEEFGPEPVGDGEDMEVSGSDGRRVRWLAQDTGGGFCLLDSGEIVAHPSEEADGDPITDQDIRFYLEHRNFGEEFYRAYAVYADSQFRITWGGEPPVYDVSVEMKKVPKHVKVTGSLDGGGGLLNLNPTLTNNGDTPITCYLWVTIASHPAMWETVTLLPGEIKEVPMEFSFEGLGAHGMNTTHHWTNFSIEGTHQVYLEVFPLGAEDGNPDDNTVSFSLQVGEGDDDGFFSSGGEGYALIGFVVCVVVLVIAIVLYRRREEEEPDMAGDWDEEA